MENKIKISISFLLLSILFVSGCTGMNFQGIMAALGVGEPEYVASEKIDVSVDPTLTELESGEKNNVYFEVENTGNKTINNIEFRITDPCKFDLDQDVKTIDELEAGQYVGWDWDLEAKDVQVSHNCNIRYQVEYDSETLSLYDIAAMSEDEYLRQKKQGTLESGINLNYYKLNSPVQIDMSLSDNQPFLENEEFFLHFTMNNNGDGNVEDLEIKSGQMFLLYPDFLHWEDGWCQGEMSEGSIGTSGLIEFPNPGDGSISDDLSQGTEMKKIELSHSKKITGDSTTPITCKFIPKEGLGVLKQGYFKAGVKYKYLVSEEFILKVLPR